MMSLILTVVVYCCHSSYLQQQAYIHMGHLKGTVPPKMEILPSFRTCVPSFLLWNTKEELKKKNQHFLSINWKSVIDYHCVNKFFLNILKYLFITL